MADSGGPTLSGDGGNNEGVAGSIGGDDDIIRIDPGAIDASASASGTTNANAKPGYGPNGRKLRKDGTERAAKGSGGNARASTEAKAGIPVDALAGTIVGLHALLSATLKIPELALAQSEGQVLASALANLQRYYPVHVTEKALAWGNVFSALGIVYGTRLGAMMARQKAERQDARSPNNVVRPPQFQQRPTVQQPPAQQPVVATPDGDPVSAAPSNSGARAMDNAERVFASLPPELI